MKQMQRTAAARAATKRIRLAMPPEERRKLGLHLLAVLSGYRTRDSYRRRGIKQCVEATAGRKRYCERLQAQKKALLEQSSTDFTCVRAKINVGW